MDNLLSIVIANKDHASLLIRQLTSILGQTSKPDEIIVIDDGTTNDNSKEVIQNFYDVNKNDFNIKIELNEVNKGVIATLNRGVEISDCNYFYFASADDYILPDFVRLHKYAIDSSQPSLVVSDHNLPKQGPSQGLQDMGSYYIPGHCSSIKKEALFEFCGFIEEFNFKCDWFLFHSIALKYGWYTIQQTLSIKTSHADSYANRAVAEGRHIPIIKAMENRVLTDPLYDDIRDEMLQLIRKP